jgi:hypothetical protein
VRVEIPGLGAAAYDAKSGWYESPALSVPVLGGAKCSFVVDGYAGDPAPSDFHDAIAAFLALDAAVLATAALPIFDYYLDVRSEFGDQDGFPLITVPDEVWQHIRYGQVTVGRGSGRDGDSVFVSVEAECAWEPEHGLQIVFRGGQAVTKVGPFDGHYSHASAFDSDDLVGVVYRRWV